MKTLNNLKLRIMVRAFRIRLTAGEAFEDIAADYPALTTDALEALKRAGLDADSVASVEGNRGFLLNNTEVLDLFFAQRSRLRPWTYETGNASCVAADVP